MHFMNRMDIEQKYQQFGLLDNALGIAVRFLREYQLEVDEHSDGWPYWSAPVKAADRLMTLIENPQELTMSRLRSALTPIKSFYTRKGYAAGMRFPEVGVY